MAVSSKIVASAAIDFVITWGTAYMAMPINVELSPRMLITMTVGAVVATAKGLQTYHAEFPKKKEVPEDGWIKPSGPEGERPGRREV